MGENSECELDPRVWSKLPAALLESVFVRLPTDTIRRIACLSKEWQQALAACSSFTRTCAEFQPNLCGMMGFNYTTKTCWVRVYDTDACKWLQPFSINDIPNEAREAHFARAACDGGLVCLVRYTPCPEGVLDLQPGPIFVLNPLTRQWRQIPPNGLVRICKMVQLKVDRNTGMYKIFLAGYVDFGSKDHVTPAAEVYDSNTNEWCTVSSGLILGRTLDDDDGWPEVYDCSTGEFRMYFPPPRDEGGVMERFKTHLNDLYVLERVYDPEPLRNEDGLIISDDGIDGMSFSRFAVCKYVDGNWRFGPDGSLDVARLPVMYECNVEDIPGDTTFFACGTFVMVARHSPENGCIMMLYDMKQGKWHEFGYTEENMIFSEDIQRAFGCELRWDARP